MWNLVHWLLLFMASGLFSLAFKQELLCSNRSAMNDTDGARDDAESASCKSDSSSSDTSSLSSSDTDGEG